MDRIRYIKTIGAPVHSIQDNLNQQSTKLDCKWLTNNSVYELHKILEIKTLFEQNWFAVNLGENLLNDFINSCKHRTCFTSEFVELTQKQIRWRKQIYWRFTISFFRERCLKFFYSLEFKKDLSFVALYEILKRNLSTASMATFLHTFSLSNVEEQLNFTLGNKDKEQWNVRNQ